MRLVQLFITLRHEGWTLLKDGIEQGSYAELSAAEAVAAMLAEQIRLAGNECELVIQRNTDWSAEPCPDTPQAAAPGR